VVTSGVKDLDRMLSGGLRGGELLILAARPSIGKTALMLHMARRTHSVVFSLEMPKKAILNRLTSTHAGVSYDVAMNPNVIGDATRRDHLRDRWLTASEEVATWPLVILDGPHTTAQITATVDRLRQERPVDAVYVDHLGWLNDQFRYSSQYERASELSRRVKRVALSTGLPVVALSQLNRDVESNPGCVPFLSNLRDSGKVEEDADAVILLYRRFYYVQKGMVKPGPEDYITGKDWERVSLSIAKNRNGETGSIDLGWEPFGMRYHEVSERSAA
jgi:replicative DNA helicase